MWACQKSRTVSTVLPGWGFMTSCSFASGGRAGTGRRGLALGALGGRRGERPGERREPGLDADHLPEQEIVPAQALAGRCLEHGLDELGVEDAGPPEPLRGQRLPDHGPEVLLVLLDRVEGESPFPLVQHAV